MKVRVLATTLALLAATPALAQDISPALDPTTMIGYAGTIAADQHLRRQLGATLASRAPARPRTRSQPRPSLAQVVARTSYRPDPAVRNRVYARSIAMMGKAGPASVAKYRQILMSGKMRDEVATYLARHGMSANNLVDTTAVYLAVAWLAAHGSNGEPTPAQLRGLRAQVAMAYAATPEILRASNAAKQELGEANILQASLSSSVAEQAAKDPRVASKARAAVAQWVRESYHIDLSRMNLTNQGLR